jgi:hypothetical protein
VYARIAAELRTKYSLAYTPSNRVTGQQFRRIDVRVVTHPAYRTKARVGYTPEVRRADTSPLPVLAGLASVESR